MIKDSPDHYDAELVIKLYELRRDPVMREARASVSSKFWPKSVADVIAVAQSDHPLNAPFRQVASYWEMVYGMAKHGVIHADFMLESNGEGLYLFAKVEPYLEQYRAEHSAHAFRNAEWVANETASGRRLLEHFRRRVQQLLATK